MVEVACAIIEFKGKVLVTQRGASMSLPFKWEFPGGKVEIGETAEKCIVREIAEELTLTIEPIEKLDPSIYHYDKRSIRLIPFICRILSGKIVLREHANFTWLHPVDLTTLDWADADIPVVMNYIARTSKNCENDVRAI